MNFLRKTAAVLLFAIALGHADDFMGLPIEDGASKDERPLPSFIFGGGASLLYYLKSIDGSVSLDAEYRVHKNVSLGLYGTVPFVADFLEFGLDCHWYFKGSLMRSGHDDYLKFAVSAFYLDYDETYFSPVISFGYGRDMLFFKKADLFGRFEFYGSVVAGHPVEKENEKMNIVGPYMEPVRFFLHARFSILFF
ncbi:MAG: hypothetical protein IK012_03495 [Fibrobacter sp.]|uniref:hypothetical protein n=1 Tax=Fibrobacter sp. TaxID=35828 RepID=UPI0025C650AA|nr:hypothetical protein [Fibrobacter sp.]MBR4784302.1 hypothetical protein [Fibrobacter sp.]